MRGKLTVGICWEQQSASFQTNENGHTDPVEILEQVGAIGRDMFLEVLCINYREETEALLNSLKRFERVQARLNGPRAYNQGETNHGKSS